MKVTIQPPAVTAIGNAARDVGETVLANVPKELTRGQERLGRARIHELASKGALDAVLSQWIDNGDEGSRKTVSVGNKFISTVNIYVTSDHESGSLFNFVPPYRGERGDR